MYSSVHFDLAVNQQLSLFTDSPPRWTVITTPVRCYLYENSPVPNKDQFAMVHFMSICMYRGIV